MEVRTSASAAKAWREQNPERVREYRLKRFTDDPVTSLALTCLGNARGRARRGGRECTLTLEWVVSKIASGLCEATGLQFDLVGAHRGGRLHSPWAPSIDRINNDGGYTESNCQVVVYLYNMAKAFSTEEEFSVLVRALAKPLFQRAIAQGKIVLKS